MSGAELSIPEKSQPEVRTVRYPGCNVEIREIDMKDVIAINGINKALDSKEYDETDSEETVEETTEWLGEEVTRTFDAITQESLRERYAAIGTTEGQHLPSKSMILATVPLDEAGRLSSYTLLSPSEDLARLPEELRQQYTADTVVDISFVSPAKGKERTIKEIEESLLQVSLMLTERAAGKSAGELTGEMTLEQQNLAKQRLSILANASVSNEQVNDRAALEKAGFKAVHRYTYKEDGIEYIVYATSPENLSQALKQKQQSAKTSSV